MQTAFFINNVSPTIATPVSGLVSVTVDFQIHNNGPAHVAGLVFTTDDWKTTQVVPAVFQGFGQGFEFWSASPPDFAGPPATFDFVVFCDDFSGGDQVPRIWNTNGGNRFRHSL